MYQNKCISNKKLDRKYFSEGKTAAVLFFSILLLSTFFVFGRVYSKILSFPVWFSKSVSEKRYQETYINHINSDFNFKFKDLVNTPSQSDINGDSAIVVDINTGEVVFEKNSSEQKQIASLVKIMTAVVALEHKNLDSEITISKESASIGENRMGISEGETYSLRELLYGLLLNSGNDSAYAVAEGVAGDSRTFVSWMNKKAQELHLEHTHFADPSGLDDGTYSTAQDLTTLTVYALHSLEFREFVKTFSYEIYYTQSHPYIYLENQTNLLTTYPGVRGVKTGYTEEAGLCLVTYAKNEDVELVGVVLNSNNRKGDMVLMLDHGFAAKGVRVEHPLLEFE